MTTLARPKKRPTYTQALDIVRRLPPAEQRRLRDELARSSGVQLVRPTESIAVRRQGRRLAKAIRAELAEAVTNSLDEAMHDLRGRAWS
jgi:hypothetical protein